MSASADLLHDSADAASRRRRFACPVCDQRLYIPQPLEAGKAADCIRCGHRLTIVHHRWLERSSALCAAAFVLLACASAYPFLGFSTAGQASAMTLLDSAISLYRSNEHLLGLLIFTLIFAAPAVMLLSTLTLLTLLRSQTPFSGLPYLTRTVFALYRWNMVEVFLLSVIVSIAKFTSMASVHIGPSFWAFVGFTVCTLVAIAYLDEFQIWRRIEALLR